MEEFMKKSIFYFLSITFLTTVILSDKILAQESPKLLANNLESYAAKETGDPAINDFVAVDKEPVPQKLVRPVYPEIAIKAGVKGHVYVRVLIDPSGKPKNAVIIKSDAVILDNFAVQAALKSIFEPAVRQGTKISYWTTIPFSFKM
jgi:TonB family protein